MEVNEALVDKLANLARLSGSALKKKPAIQNDLQRMIQFVEKLNETPLAWSLYAAHERCGKRIAGKMRWQQHIHGRRPENAPVHDAQFLKVPKVIKKKLQVPASGLPLQRLT